jgi:hypothetical protein
MKHDYIGLHATPSFGWNCSGSEHVDAGGVVKDPPQAGYIMTAKSIPCNYERESAGVVKSPPLPLRAPCNVDWAPGGWYIGSGIFINTEKAVSPKAAKEVKENEYLVKPVICSSYAF